MDSDENILRPGGTFKGYQLTERLGTGAMGEVWKATQIALRRPVAIKFLKAEAAKSENLRQRFMREGEAAARVRHPNVVEVLDVGVVGGTPYLVMEFLDGEDLRAFFTRRAPLPISDLADVIAPVCAAVALAHDEGVIHRDLKPENIFLARTRDRGVIPKVVDFGISRISDDESGRVHTATAALMGTPLYMSPEAAQGAKLVDARSDQYSLGVILYQGATGRVPINEPALFPLLQRVVAGSFDPPSALRPDLPAAFEEVVLRAMATRPEDRFASARALGAALLPFASPRIQVACTDALIDDHARTLPDAAWHAIAPPAPVAPISVPPPTATFQPTGTVPMQSPGAFEAPPPHTTTLSKSVRVLPIAADDGPRSRKVPVLTAGVAAAALVITAVVSISPRSSPTRPAVAPAPAVIARPAVAPASTVSDAQSPVPLRVLPARPAVVAVEAPPSLPVPSPAPRVAGPVPSRTPSMQRPTRPLPRGPSRAIEPRASGTPPRSPAVPRATTAGGAPID